MGECGLGFVSIFGIDGAGRNARIETVLMFAQAVYLMFSSVYVCKETVEHLLLSASSGEGHHHHHGDEEVGLGYVICLYFLLEWLIDNVQNRIPRVSNVHHAHFTYQHCALL
jgi:hypothetical protein